MIGIVAIGCMSNCIRGGQWRIWFSLREDQLKWLSSDNMNSLIYGALVFALTINPWLALISIGAMRLGAAPGWGDYIGAVAGWKKEGLVENKYIDIIVYPLKNHPVIWGFAGLTVRGLLWGIYLAAPFIFYGYMSVALSLLLCSATMGFVYLAALKWMETRVGHARDGWGLGELLYGGVLWSSLAGLL